MEPFLSSFVLQCLRVFRPAASQLTDENPWRLYHRRAGEVLMIEKKPPGPPSSTPEVAPASESPGPAKKRTPNVKDHIGRQLRALYDEVAAQPVPDRFMELLNRLDAKNGEE
jgi:Anti-sigma factor NepR